MTLKQLLNNKFKSNQSVHRVFNEYNSSGFLACGFVKKTKTWGNNIDCLIPNYDGVWVLSGSGLYQDEHQEIEIKAGDLIQRLPNQKHNSIITSDDWMELYIGIGGDLYNMLRNIDVLSQKKPVLSPGLDYKLLEEFIDFYDELNALGPMELPLLVPKAIAILSRVHYLDKKYELTTGETMILEMSRSYMLKNINQRLTVEDIANYVNIGYEKFRKLFTNHFGVSPGYYMQQHRIHKAQILLGQEDMTIKEIAAELGYTDAYTFSKQFKKLTNMAPKDFRAMYLE